MKSNYRIMIAVFILTLAFGFQSVNAQAKSVPAKVKSVIAFLLADAKQPDAHSADDVYLVVTIGKIDYVAELASGKIVNQKKVEEGSGGFSGAYAEVQINFLNKDQQPGGGQDAGNLLKLTGAKWKLIARNETDYQCGDVKSVPKSVLKTLHVECN